MNKKIIPFILPFLNLQTIANACAVCFKGSEDDPSNRALRWSVICLLVILLAVLASFAKFFLSVKKREKLLMPGDLYGHH